MEVWDRESGGGAETQIPRLGGRHKSKQCDHNAMHYKQIKGKQSSMI
jgi:hypothetical protein